MPSSPPSTEQTIRGIRGRWFPRGEQGSGGLTDRVLAARGIGPDRVESFLEPSLLDLHDPSLIPDLDRAAERLLDACRAREPIIIYGDYDVDGVTATAILYHMILALEPAAVVRTYVPHRLDEGYGLNAEAIRQLAGEGARVIVSVDCGVTATESARVARQLGVELIITDHHNPPATLEELPDAYAVVHPGRPDSAYPFGHLCGAGVAYKLAWRLATMHNGSDRVSPSMKKMLVDLLAFASLGTVADVVPLIGENRIITRHGLGRIRSSPFAGLRAIVNASGLGGENVNAEHVGFRLAPRLNAVGRLGHAAQAVELMTTADADRAAVIARQLSDLNEERRRIELTIFDQAVEMAERSGMTGDDRRAIVLAHTDWHPGVVGIVCSRLADRYSRPVILLQRGQDRCKGSGRSIDGFSLHAALCECGDRLDEFGGHDMAAGMSTTRFDEFAERFVEVANDRLAIADMIRTYSYDTEAELSELTVDGVRDLDRLSPFGRGNQTPTVLMRGLKLDERPRPFGKQGRHLDLRVRSGSRQVRIVGWSWADRVKKIPAGAGIDVIIEPKLSYWSGRATVEPTLVDLRVV